MDNRLKTFLMLLLAALLLAACSPRLAPISTDVTTRVDSVYIIEKPVLVEVPGGKVEATINYDSLRALWTPGTVKEIITRTDTTGNARLRILINELGHITALCEAQDQTIEYMQKEINRLSSEQRTVTITQVKELRFIPWWIWALVGALAVPAALGVLRILSLLTPLRL